jgi:ketosteroid isomerase-like protein
LRKARGLITIIVGAAIGRTSLGEETMSKQRGFVWTTAAALVGLAALFSGSAYASDSDDVKAAIDNYHAAIASLDLTKIEPVWVHDDTIVDLEPGAKTITTGWDATKMHFEGLIAAVAQLTIVQSQGPYIRVQGDLAWSAGTVKVDGKLKSGQPNGGNILEADVFKKQDGHWLLISHVASILP